MKLSQKTQIICLLLFSGLCGFIFSLYQHRDAPVQPSHLRENQVTHTPVTFVQQIKNDPDAGQKIYKEFCAACHAKTPLVDIEAPRIGDKNIKSKYRKSGISSLLETTIEGKKAMPARGGCFECSDDQLKEAILFMWSSD